MVVDIIKAYNGRVVDIIKAFNGRVVDIIKAYNGLEPGRLSLLVPTFCPELPRHLGNSGSCHKSTDCRDF